MIHSVVFLKHTAMSKDGKHTHCFLYHLGAVANATVFQKDKWDATVTKQEAHLKTLKG